MIPDRRSRIGDRFTDVRGRPTAARRARWPTPERLIGPAASDTRGQIGGGAREVLYSIGDGLAAGDGICRRDASRHAARPAIWCKVTD